jgi:hypothetical protein
MGTGLPKKVCVIKRNGEANHGGGKTLECLLITFAGKSRESERSESVSGILVDQWLKKHGAGVEFVPWLSCLHRGWWVKKNRGVVHATEFSHSGARHFVWRNSPSLTSPGRLSVPSGSGSG